jgi:hypothetical protein
VVVTVTAATADVIIITSAIDLHMISLSNYETISSSSISQGSRTSQLSTYSTIASSTSVVNSANYRPIIVADVRFNSSFRLIATTIISF